MRKAKREKFWTANRIIAYVMFIVFTLAGAWAGQRFFGDLKQRQREAGFNEAKVGCHLRYFEDEHIELRRDLIPYTRCECVVTNDDDMTRACCCKPI